MSDLEAIGTVATVLSAVAFALYIVGLFQLPTDERPATPTLNRFGEEIGSLQNPGYRETEDESQSR
jgi:hypothetical protein